MYQQAVFNSQMLILSFVIFFIIIVGPFPSCIFQYFVHFYHPPASFYSWQLQEKAVYRLCSWLIFCILARTNPVLSHRLIIAN